MESRFISSVFLTDTSARKNYGLGLWVLCERYGPEAMNLVPVDDYSVGLIIQAGSSGRYERPEHFIAQVGAMLGLGDI